MNIFIRKYPSNLKKLFLIFFFLSFLFDVWAAERLNIRQAFLKNKHAKFIETLRSLTFPPYESKTWNAGKVSAQDIAFHLELFQDAGIVDVENQYIHYERHTGAGPIKRTYALYYDKAGLAIMAMSEHNPSSFSQYTTFTAICQTRKDTWKECTQAVFPPLEIASLVKEGAQLDKKYGKYLNLYYQLPRYGTKIKVSVIYDAYPYAGMGTDPQTDPRQKELSKLTRTSFTLNWDKGKKKFVFDQ